MTHPTDSQAAPPGRPDSPLGPYRVLDLTEGGVNWAGRLLSDMGADVIKVEPPGGSPTRNRGPFYQDEPHPERSLYWTAYNLNKRGVTLDLERPEGQDLFTRLAATSDFILESSTPGTMRDLGLGYEQMSALNPGIIYTSITPFGQSGPYARYKTTDMALWAMGGALYVCGDGDRPPARVSVPQAEHQGGAQGAAGSLIALFARHATGEGQHVDISIQAAVIRVLMNAASNSVLMGVNIERGGGTKKFEDLTVRDVFPTLDGYIAGTVSGGKRRLAVDRGAHPLDGRGGQGVGLPEVAGLAHHGLLQDHDRRRPVGPRLRTVPGRVRRLLRLEDEGGDLRPRGERQDVARAGEQHEGTC